MTGRKYKNMITSTYDWKINTKREPDAGFLNFCQEEHGLAETASKIAMNVALRRKVLLKTFSGWFITPS